MTSASLPTKDKIAQGRVYQTFEGFNRGPRRPGHAAYYCMPPRLMLLFSSSQETSTTLELSLSSIPQTLILLYSVQIYQ